MCFCAKSGGSKASRNADGMWFSACLLGDTAFVRARLEKLKRSVDKRETNPAENVYRGFTGLHYACIGGSVDTISLLLEHEYDLCTQEEALLNMAVMSADSTKYKSSKGTSPLMIAIISGKIDAAFTILNFANARGEAVLKRIVGIQNSQGQTALMCLCMINHIDVLKILYAHQKLLMRHEINAETVEGLTALHIAAMFGRNYLLDSICKTLFNTDAVCAADLDFKISFVRALLKQDRNGRDIFYYAGHTVQYGQFATSPESKRTCAIIMRPLFEQVVQWVITDPVAEAKEHMQRRNQLGHFTRQLNDAIILSASEDDFFINKQMASDKELLKIANRLDLYINYCQLLKVQPDEALISLAQTYLDGNNKFFLKEEMSLMTSSSVFGQPESSHDPKDTLHSRQNSGFSVQSEDTASMHGFGVSRDAASRMLDIDENGMLVLHDVRTGDVTLNVTAVDEQRIKEDFDN